MKIIFWVRSIIATAYFIVLTAAIATAVIFSVVILRRQDFSDKLIWFWGRSLTWAFNIDVELLGEENIPKEGCLFVFNHSSHFDIIIFASAIKKHARFGAKIELFKIPIFGPAMRAAGVLPITRAERSKVLRLYDESIARVHKGESFILACEGTRQPRPGVGERFKSGPFIFAINGQFPVVPVVIRGAAEVLAKGDLIACTKAWKHKARVEVLPAMPTAGLTMDDRPQLQEEVRARMTAAYYAG